MGREVDGHVVLLTGAARGIGAAAATRLAESGARVVISDRDEAAAVGLARALSERGRSAEGVRCDVTESAEVESMISDIGARWGRIDALVNNAGFYPQLDFRSTTLADYDRVMGINVRGAFVATMAVIPWMETAGGSIVFLSSGAGTLAAIEQPTARSLPLYGAAKAALDRWALGVAGELAELGIAANVLYPGAFVRTDGLAALDLDDTVRAAAVGPEFVAPAIDWLVRARVADMSGRLVRADEYGRTWGPESEDS